jgi:ribosomal protein S18 acetylase RimI-like enzyme
VRTWGLFARNSANGRAIERDGVFAAVVPATPKRSVANSVLYSDTAALEAALGDLAAAYDEAGVEAWTVWVPEGDEAAAAVLAEAGHVLDGVPRAMGAELHSVERPSDHGADLSAGCDLAAVGRVNDAAYGFGADGVGPVISTLPPDQVHAYGARADGDTVAVMIAVDSAENTEIAWVATLPEARGRGLATALMRRALWDSRERGNRTATLQATKLGAPVYERVGFRDVGELQMWERRR